VDTAYGADFYAAQMAGSEQSAEVVVPIVQELLSPSSVCDVGCGVGAWLSAFRNRGIDDILGIDGGNVPRVNLRIPQSRFVEADFDQPFCAAGIDRTFDLALSLEVAEHLRASVASEFICALTSLAPVVLFSAAIPGQGGTGHINEQWPDYWDRLFGAFDYIGIDAIRWRIWENDKVEWWYRQNAFFYVRRPDVARYPRLTEPVPVDRLPKRLVHPRKLEQVRPKPEYLLSTLKKLPRLFAEAVRRRTHA